MNKRKILNALRSAFSALLLRRQRAMLPLEKRLPKRAPLPLRWVERRPDYYLDGHGSVRRVVAKKPSGMSARQWKKQKKAFQRAVTVYGPAFGAHLQREIDRRVEDVMLGQLQNA